MPNPFWIGFICGAGIIGCALLILFSLAATKVAARYDEAVRQSFGRDYPLLPFDDSRGLG